MAIAIAPTMPSSAVTMIGTRQPGAGTIRVPTAAPQFRHHSCSSVIAAPQRGQWRPCGCCGCCGWRLDGRRGRLGDAGLLALGRLARGLRGADGAHDGDLRVTSGSPSDSSEGVRSVRPLLRSGFVSGGSSAAGAPGGLCCRVGRRLALVLGRRSPRPCSARRLGACLGRRLGACLGRRLRGASSAGASAARLVRRPRRVTGAARRGAHRAGASPSGAVAARRRPRAGASPRRRLRRGRRPRSARPSGSITWVASSRAGRRGRGAAPAPADDLVPEPPALGLGERVDRSAPAWAWRPRRPS